MRSFNGPGLFYLDAQKKGSGTALSHYPSFALGGAK
mgnify:CR=1 FL=1